MEERGKGSNPVDVIKISEIPPENMAPADSLHAQDDSATVSAESESEQPCVEDWMEPLEDDIDDDEDIDVLSGDVSMNGRTQAEDLGRVVKEPPCVDWTEPLDFDGSNIAGPGRKMNPKNVSFMDHKKAVKLAKQRIDSFMRQRKNVSLEGWEDWPILGEGWKRKLHIRHLGRSAGKSDAYYLSPEMVQVRSRPALEQVMERDLSMFDFKKGVFKNAPVVGWLGGRKKKEVKRDFCPPPEVTQMDVGEQRMEEVERDFCPSPDVTRMDGGEPRTKKVKGDFCPPLEVTWMDRGQPRKKKVKRRFHHSPEVTWLDGGEPEHKDPLWNPMSSIKWKRKKKKEKKMKVKEQTVSDEIHNDHNYCVNETERMDRGERPNNPVFHLKVTPSGSHVLCQKKHSGDICEHFQQSSASLDSWSMGQYGVYQFKS